MLNWQPSIKRVWNKSTRRLFRKFLYGKHITASSPPIQRTCTRRQRQWTCSRSTTEAQHAADRGQSALRQSIMYFAIVKFLPLRRLCLCNSVYYFTIFSLRSAWQWLTGFCRSISSPRRSPSSSSVWWTGCSPAEIAEEWNVIDGPLCRSLIFISAQGCSSRSLPKWKCVLWLQMCHGQSRAIHQPLSSWPASVQNNDDNLHKNNVTFFPN